MKINFLVRAKNPWFWVGLVGTILAAMGVSPEMFTSWGAVWDAICSLFSNPFQIGCVVLAVLGVYQGDLGVLVEQVVEAFECDHRRFLLTSSAA